jgi:hypothetical protein
MEIQMREFNFYLDAWKFCYLNNISYSCIRRKDWASWTVEFGNMKVVDLPSVSQAA